MHSVLSPTLSSTYRDSASASATPTDNLPMRLHQTPQPHSQPGRSPKLNVSPLARQSPSFLEREKPALSLSAVKVESVPPLRSGFKSPSTSPTSHHAKAKSKGLPALDLTFATPPINSPSPRHLQSTVRKAALADLHRKHTVTSPPIPGDGTGFCVNATPIPTPTATATVSATSATPGSSTSPLSTPNVNSTAKKLKCKSQKLLRKFSVPVYKWKEEAGHFLGRKQRDHAATTIAPMVEDEYNSRSEAHETHNLVSFYQAQAMSSVDLRSSPRQGDNGSPFGWEPRLEHQNSSGHGDLPSTPPIPPILHPISHPNPQLHKAQSVGNLRRNARRSRLSTIEVEDVNNASQHAKATLDATMPVSLLAERPPRSAAHRQSNTEIGPFPRSLASSAQANGPSAAHSAQHHLDGQVVAPYHGSSPKQKATSLAGAHYPENTELQSAHTVHAAQCLTAANSENDEVQTGEQSPGESSSGGASFLRLSPSDLRVPTKGDSEVSAMRVSPSPLRSILSGSPVPPPAQLDPNRHRRRTLYSTATLQDAFQYDDMASSTPTRLISPSRASSTLSPAPFSPRGSGIETSPGSEPAERDFTYDSVLSTRSATSRSSAALAGLGGGRIDELEGTDDERMRESVRAACARQEEFVRSFSTEYAKRSNSPRSVATTTVTSTELKPSPAGKQRRAIARENGFSFACHRISTIASGEDEVALAMSLLEGKSDATKALEPWQVGDVEYEVGSTSFTLATSPTPSPHRNGRERTSGKTSGGLGA